VVQLQANEFQRMSELCAMLDALPTILLILNQSRQIVHANRAAIEAMGVPKAEAICGLRPGELLDCEHAQEPGSGCGLTEFCTRCGAAQAATGAEGGAATVRECRVIQKGTGRARNLRVSATPFLLKGQTYNVMALTDIEHEKRRQSLERLFFHDLLNITSGILGYAELMQMSEPSQIAPLGASVQRLARKLADEIRAQRELAEAETNELTVHWGPVNARSLLLEVVEIYQSHDAGRDRGLKVDPQATDASFTTDRTLLTRVLGNMVKNALEACEPGQEVTLGCRTTAGGQVEFWVHNPGVMDRDVQLQVFQRAFSTKGPGRGLGTYSIKLLTERYLQGHVSFISSTKQGTVFRVRYPLEGGEQTGS